MTTATQSRAPKTPRERASQRSQARQAPQASAPKQVAAPKQPAAPAKDQARQPKHVADFYVVPRRGKTLIDDDMPATWLIIESVVSPWEPGAQRILALRALGRTSEACSEATKFVAANESSPLLPQVRAACDGIQQHP